MSALRPFALLLLAHLTIAATVFAQVETTTVPIDVKSLVPRLAWGADGKSLWCVGKDGHVQVYSVPAFERTGDLQLNAKATDFGLSKEGPIVLLGATQVLVHLDHDLQEVQRLPAPGVDSLTTAVTLDHVFLVAEAGIGDWDLKRNRVRGIPTTTFARAATRAKRTEARPAAIGFRFATCTPDGEYLVTAPDHRITRFAIGRGGLALEEQGWKIGSSGTPSGLHVGGNPPQVALTFGSGNNEVPGHPKTNYGTYVYDLENLRVPKTTIESGAYPRSVGFDPAAGLVYAQNHDRELIVFNQGGTNLGEFDLGPKNSNESTQSFLPHPDGGRTLVLTDRALYWCTMPEAWVQRNTPE